MHYKLSNYLKSDYYLIDSKIYYLQLSIIICLAFTAFVYFFDPYENYAALPKYDVPIRIIQLGYGLITAVIIYSLYLIFFHKIGFGNGKLPWKTYHHWLFLFTINVIAAYLNTTYHRFIMNVGEIDLNYVIFITAPKSISFGLVIAIISVLLDGIYSKNKLLENLKTAKEIDYQVKFPQTNDYYNKELVLLESPTTNQSVTLHPSDIIFIKSFGNYVAIQLKSESKVKLLRASLYFVAEKLQDFHYIKKCHRQYYININEVEGYKGNSQKLNLQIKNFDRKIPVSKKFVNDIIGLLS